MEIDEEENKTKKINKVIIICGIVAAALIIIIVIVMLFIRSPKDVTVPKNLVGKDQELVEERLKKRWIWYYLEKSV